MRHDVIVIGGGPAGLAAACAAHENGARGVLVLERDRDLGGILNQCIHNGFGLHYFREELTGPEYAERFVRRVAELPIEVMSDTMVIALGRDKSVTCVNSRDGYRTLRAGAVVLCMGCRERTRGALAIPGSRPSGILTAGAAQRYVNMEGYMVGRRAVILGSGDIGLIMARRLALEGAEVLACIEVMPFSSGLNRNKVQCLDDFGIPLHLSHTITNIVGKNRVEKVVVNRVDSQRRPIPGTEIEFACDTVLLSVGLIPENELTREAGIPLDPRTRGPMVFENMETAVPGIFAAGNVVHVHDIVDFVTREGERAGAAAARHIRNEPVGDAALTIQGGSGVAYTVPQHIRTGGVEKDVDIFFRVDQCYRNVDIRVTDDAAVLRRSRRDHMAPGEMEMLRIPSGALGRSHGNTLTVAVVPQEG